MKIRIYVMTHKKFEMPQSPLFRPLHVGRACGENLGYPGDDAARQKELFAQITADKKALDGTTADTVTV